MHLLERVLRNLVARKVVDEADCKKKKWLIASNYCMKIPYQWDSGLPKALLAAG